MAYEEGSDELVKAYKKATPGEDVVDPADKGEYDNEGQMAKTQLRGIVADASHMIQMFSDEQNLPEWVQNKITKSADYLNSAHRYMMNKENVNEASLRMKIAKRGSIADKIRDYGRKSGGIDKAAFLKIAAMIDGSESNAKIQSAIQKMDTDPRDWIIKTLDDNGFIKGGKVKVTESLKKDTNEANRGSDSYRVKYKGDINTVRADSPEDALKKSMKAFGISSMNKRDYMKNASAISEAIDWMSAGKYARVMNPKTREIKKVLKTDVRKYVQKGWTHMTQLKNRITKEETINERLNLGDFVVGSEKDKDGYRPKVTYKKGGRIMYLGATSYKDKKTAEGEAEAYLLGYNRAGQRGAENAAWKFKQKNEAKKYTPPTKAEIEADKKKDRKGKPRPSMSTKSVNKNVYKNMTEKLTVADGMAAWIDDFQKSDAPQFEGKDKEERRNMAIAAYLAAKREEKDKGKSESSKAYGKSLRTMRDKEKNKRISSKDKETLGKLADLLAKEKGKRK